MTVLCMHFGMLAVLHYNMDMIHTVTNLKVQIIKVNAAYACIGMVLDEMHKELFNYYIATRITKSKARACWSQY